MSFQDAVSDAISPFRCLNSIYSDMMDSMKNHVSMTWSFFVSNDDGTVILVKSQPRFLDLGQIPERLEGNCKGHNSYFFRVYNFQSVLMNNVNIIR